MHHHDFLWRPRRGRRVILLALGLIFFSPAAVLAEAPAQTLALPEAVSRALELNPGLQVFTPRLKGLEGKRLTADQNPAFELGFEAENVLGSGPFNGIDGAEYTLSIASVIELGGKREARTRAVSGRYALVEAERDLVVVNSCSVTREAVRHTRQAIRRARKAHPAARLLVTGCAAETEREALLARLSSESHIDGLEGAPYLGRFIGSIRAELERNAREAARVAPDLAQAEEKLRAALSEQKTFEILRLSRMQQQRKDRTRRAAAAQDLNTLQRWIRPG